MTNTVSNSSPNDSSLPLASHIHNVRPCPCCGVSIFGMPGGRDAHCSNCGYKDPCCSD